MVKRVFEFGKNKILQVHFHLLTNFHKTTRYLIYQIKENMQYVCELSVKSSVTGSTVCKVVEVPTDVQNRILVHQRESPMRVHNNEGEPGKLSEVTTNISRCALALKILYKIKQHEADCKTLKF